MIERDKAVPVKLRAADSYHFVYQTPEGEFILKGLQASTEQGPVTLVAIEIFPELEELGVVERRLSWEEYDEIASSVSKAGLS